MAVHSVMKFQHLPMVWVHRESSTAVTQSSQYITCVLMESRPQV
ncbi:hypothetical protein OIU78_021839 [Salix suchowensis]|nr:hypothetical protein OIU78_021839 [Salix suchowensis]